MYPIIYKYTYIYLEEKIPNTLWWRAKHYGPYVEPHFDLQMDLYETGGDVDLSNLRVISTGERGSLSERELCHGY